MASYGCSEDPSGRYLLVVPVAADVFFPNAARLPWAHTPRLQQLRPFLLTTNVSNKSGNLLSLKGNSNELKTLDSGTVLAQWTLRFPAFG